MSLIQKLSCALLVCLFLTGNVTYAASLAFNQAELTSIKEQNKGKKWLMLMWSVDCPPCFKELAVIKKLAQQGANLNIVLVNADASEEVTKERVNVIEEFQLNNLVNLHFVDGKAEHSRFLIDSTWFGELPRSYFVDANGQFHGKSGLVKESLISQWLLQ